MRFKWMFWSLYSVLVNFGLRQREICFHSLIERWETHYSVVENEMTFKRATISAKYVKDTQISQYSILCT